MSTQLAILASGSSGNAYYLTDGKTRLLLDAGLSADEMEAGLAHFGVPADSIDAVVITHSHTDHTRGLRTFVMDHQPPVYLTKGTASLLRKKLAGTGGCFYTLVPESLITIGTIRLLPMRVPHDDPEPVGFAFLLGSVRAAFIADVGDISASMISVIHDVDYLFLESNHDLAALRANDRLPSELRRRIEAQHLANDQVERFINDCLDRRVRYLTLGHLSSRNNSVTAVHSIMQERLTQKGHHATELAVLPSGAASRLYTL